MCVCVCDYGSECVLITRGNKSTWSQARHRKSVNLPRMQNQTGSLDIYMFFFIRDNKDEDIKVMEGEEGRMEERNRRFCLPACMWMSVHACIHDCTSGSPKSEVPQ